MLGVRLISQYTLKVKIIQVYVPYLSWSNNNLVQYNATTNDHRLTVHNMNDGRKATCILIWENIFPAKVHVLIWVKNTREIK